MSSTAITASSSSLPPVEVALPVKAAPPSTRKPQNIFFRILAPAASLRLTVVLFALSVLLVFFGTLAQMNSGIWTVVKEYFRNWGLVWVPFQLLVQLGQRFFEVPKDFKIDGGFPFPGGWLLGTLLLVNLLAAHVVRFKINWRRSGILILHSGVVVLMVGEIVTGMFAVEGNMWIYVDGSSNYLQFPDKPELAVISPAGDTEDDVVVVPTNVLRGGGPIRDNRLPFDVTVVRYMVNSSIVDLKDAPPGTNNPADHGDGRLAVALEKPEGTGVSQEQQMDLASAYVTFSKKGRSSSDNGEVLGTYLLIEDLGNSGRMQKVRVDDKTYLVSLRPRRVYKPYTIHLDKFDYAYYPSTDVPKDFSSYIHLVDPSRNEERDARIWMNNPMSYAGETFYQQQVLGNGSGTVLQVVRNPGAWLPYIACLMVALGLILHFGLKLTEFLNKALTAAAPSPERIRIARGMWGVTAGALGLAGLYLLRSGLPPRDYRGEFSYQQAGTLPVQDHGRVKPLDTVARVNLMLISGQQEFRDADGRSHLAIEWLLDVMTTGFSAKSEASAENHKVFRIDNLDILNLLHLEPRRGFRYSLAEFRKKIPELQKKARSAGARSADDRDVFDNQIVELFGHLQAYASLADGSLRVVPPPGINSEEDWKSLRTAILEMKAGGSDNEAARAVGKVLIDYARGEVAPFNEDVADYHKLLKRQAPASTGQAGLEVFFNNFSPFYQCMLLYLGAFLLACLSWLGLREPLRRAAFWLLILTLALHTWALCMRMYLQGRPPVTNLYSSAVFIGWGCVIAGLILEYLFRIGIGAAVGGALGFATVFISHYLTGGEDTLEMMRAVLDTNFWLATHVTCVTLGYAATGFAGALGIVYLCCYAIARMDNPRQQTLVVESATRGQVDLLKVIAREMTYGTVCFAMLLSFTGTVLGGLWADYSWGRFWGWDPKENGALLIVIWNALILHARWAGWVKQPGVSRLAIVGLAIVGWSWFGTNQLGVGLHAYGFNKGLAVGLRWAWISLAAFLVLEPLVLIGWQKFIRPQRQAP